MGKALGPRSGVVLCLCEMWVWILCVCGRSRYLCIVLGASEVYPVFIPVASDGYLMYLFIADIANLDSFV